ncbi:MAG: hypothetical protein R6W84_04140 [Promethearchaeia archaeon]
MAPEYNRNMKLIYYTNGQIEIIEDDPNAENRKEQIANRKYLFTFENKYELLDLLRSDKHLWKIIKKIL